MHNIRTLRQTIHINRHQSENICHAFDYAKYIDRPLNTYVVINFRGETVELEASAVFEKIRHKYRVWLRGCARRFGLEAQRPVYVYTHENPDGHRHVNWVVHVPPRLDEEFRQKLERWMEKSQGSIGEFDLFAQPVDPDTDKTLAKYIVKGTDRRYVPYLHLQTVAAPQGVVLGRRATASPSIGRSARKKAGFIPRLHRHQWKKRAA